MNTQLNPSGLTPQLFVWKNLAAEMLHPSFQLDVEEFATIYAMYASLVRAGHRFDPMLRALMKVLQRQAFDSIDGTEDEEYGVTDAETDSDDEPRFEPLVIDSESGGVA